MLRVALYYPTRLGLWQEMVRGIFQYARPSQPWLLSLATSPNPRTVLNWRPDAVIGQLTSLKVANEFARASIPLIDTSYWFGHASVPRVRFDDFEVGCLAAEYFLQRGFQSLGAVGRTGVQYECERVKGFEDVVRAAGIQPLQPPHVVKGSDGENLGPIGSRWRKWLLTAPRPLALFLSIDSLALQVSELCRDIGLRVPEDIVLLGANDSLICQLAYPQLSSVQLPAQAMGYAAAELLAQWVDQGEPPTQEIVLPPAGIVTRQSTDIVATSNILLTEALRLIRDEAVKGLTVQKAVRLLAVSRRGLERSFRTYLGRSPLEEIHRVRIEWARRLLIDTDFPIPRVAKESGFHDARRFASRFRRAMGTTPTKYRESFR